MTPLFGLLGFIIAASAVAAVALRNLVHCALALSVSFAGLAAIYLFLNAQFVGFAQILVYIGAVAILIVFAILLTGRGELERGAGFSAGWMIGLGVALAVFGTLAGLLLSSHLLVREMPPPAPTSVRDLGDQLMTHWVLPLEVLGLLLTAALIGSVVIVMKERGPR